ncbi:MAG: hypothetical protein ACREJC_08940, partial [Tepidisphaeraceae bacterium]
VLNWEANAEPDVAGYAVLLRDTTAPTWTRRIDVGNVTSVTLKAVSKDDFLFAVECYDRAGHRSIPTVPRPRGSRASPATTRRN